MPERTMERSIVDRTLGSGTDPSNPPGSRRVAFLVAYDGRRYSGWQVQERDRTVQGELEEALAAVVGQPIRITGAGRTDAGVSAWGQVGHADLPERCTIPSDRLWLVLNQRLSPEIRVLGSARTHPDFHARYSAKRKVYRYTFRCLPEGLSGHPLSPPFSSPLDRSFNLSRAISASRHFLGTHDFRHFTVKTSCPEDPSRKISDIFWETGPEGFSFWILGPGFLHKMVRMIGGYLRDVGRGIRCEEELPELLQPGSNPPVLPISPLPPEGLSLIRVFYDALDPFDPRTRN